MTNEVSLRNAPVEPARAAARLPAREISAPQAVPPPGAALPNPRLRLDSSLGMVVIEFRGASGDVEASIPTPREIAAYRTAAMSTSVEAKPEPSEGAPPVADAPAQAPAPPPRDL